MLTIRQEQLQVLDRGMRLRFGWSVVSTLREDSPHVLQGLSGAEVYGRLESALDHANEFEITLARDLRSFIRLCFLVGPDFSTYPPFSDLLTPPDGAVSDLFDLAAPEDWEKVAILDIVGRYRHSFSGARDGNDTITHDREPLLSVVPLTAEHADAMYQHALHPDVWRLAGALPSLTVESVRDQIQQDKVSEERKRFAVLDAKLGFVGTVALGKCGEGAELSYWVRRDQWGRGIATRAIRDILSQGQARSMGSWVLATIAADNLPSIRVVEKVGFVEAVPGSGLEVPLPEAREDVRQFVHRWHEK